ncbi:alpha carbonic anhydrase 7-like [Cucurbita maxima]|uniref:Alpha carbonic anhydrase 7-like n=1 Tax=Cucurbita maxima TaxID=3661 RepID=A0A6J1J4N7_CUCMA|nr:alpha carbonic anhydrase 7-like [Cucurbita maxima]
MEAPHLLMLAICCLSLLSRGAAAAKVGGEFSYDPCSDRGPKHWGELNKDWGMCKNGRLQSPISLSKWTADLNQGLGDLRRRQRPADAYLKNDGHEIVVDWDGNDAGSIKIKNIDYQLVNYHWHHPSEHTQDGKTFPLELHMVHINNVTKNIAVIGILYEYGPPDPFIYMLERDIQNLDIDGGVEFLGQVDPRDVKLGGRKYFRYMGSLTTPPCTEGVTWTVMDKVQTVAPYQVRLLKRALVEEKNARPLQKINGRDVSYFDPYSRVGSVAAE